MKKLLLATSALVGLASTAALAGGGHAPATAAPASVNAGALNVMVGGFINVEHAIVDQEDGADSQGLNSPNSAGNTRDASFTNDAEIHVTVAGSAEDFDYGGVIELNAQLDSTDAEGGSNADRVYIFAENDGFGRVEFGGNAGASQTLEIDASNIARATGGVEGNWWHYVDTNGTSAGAAGTTFIVQPNLAVAEIDQRGSDTSKITYYTPRFSGLQLGASYTNDSGDIGSAGALSPKNTITDFANVFSGGINFEQDFDGVELGLAAVGETGTAEDTGIATARNDLNAYSVGGKVGVAGFSVAGNWADLGDSGVLTSSTNDEQSYWTAGAAYENGPYGVSVTYLNSETAGTGTAANELSNVVVGADYQLAPGLTPYVEAAFYDLDENTTGALNNEGSVVLLGAELAF